jgi:hypothetical protein
VLVRGWMTSKMHYRAGEEMAEACCATRMNEARMSAQERLGSEDQLR